MGPVARSSFDGEDGVTTDGDVTAGFLGADVARERAFARILLSQSGNKGADRAATSYGRIESAFTGMGVVGVTGRRTPVP